VSGRKILFQGEKFISLIMVVYEKMEKAPFCAVVENVSSFMRRYG